MREFYKLKMEALSMQMNILWDYQAKYDSEK